MYVNEVNDMAKNVYLESKPRYEILDGLRGVAAILVVIFHLFETYTPHGGQQHLNHGYLAVDFFFILSGFVVGYAYDDRWNSMSTWSFFKRRLTRLHPMVILGTVIGASLFFFSYDAFPGTVEIPMWKFLVCLVMGLFIIPCSKNLDIRGWNEVNSFNGPVWTLTLEYVANILYALVLRRLPKIALAALCLAAAFFTLDLTMGWDVFGLFPFKEFTAADGSIVSYGGPQYHVKGGWALNPQQMYIAFSRLGYPFLCGLLISRILPSRMSAQNPSGSPFHVKGGFWLSALLLSIILCMPCIGGTDGIPNGLFQAASILVFFPLIVLLGAGSRTTDAFSTKLCKFLGDISYPIYITHYPLIYVHMSFAAKHADAPLWMHVAASAGVVVMALIIAYGSLKAFDEPVRKWLTENWLKK